MKKRKRSEEEINTIKSKYPSFPEFAIPKTRNVSSNPTNELTQSIIDYIILNGGFAWRNNTQGTYSEKLKRFITSGALKGVSDILCCYNGLFVSIEIKRGYDKLNPDQIKFKTKIEKSKGIFWEIRSLDQFLIKWKEFTCK